VESRFSSIMVERFSKAESTVSPRVAMTASATIQNSRAPTDTFASPNPLVRLAPAIPCEPGCASAAVAATSFMLWTSCLSWKRGYRGGCKPPRIDRPHDSEPTVAGMRQDGAAHPHPTRRIRDRMP